MDIREINEKKLTLPEVKKVLDSIGEENLDQFQRRTLDYVNKFSKVKNTDSKKLLKKRLNLLLKKIMKHIELQIVT